jgi:CubicO group peptidase (beta-lactamase class C family)
VITTTTMMKLVESGLMDLDAPVDRYVRPFPNPGNAITVRRLAGHLAGIRHYRGDEALWTRRCSTPEEAVTVFRGDELLHAPGTEYLYSSWGYALLSSAIENAAELPFARAVDSLSLQPAGTRGIELEAMLKSAGTMVTPYEPDGDTVRIARPVDNSCKWGAGAFVATSGDMARFASALLAGRIVSKQSLETILKPMQTNDGTSTDYGMGIGATKDSTGRRRAVHTGSAIGGRAALYMLPDEGVVVVLLSNVEGDRLSGSAASIADRFARR